MSHYSFLVPMIRITNETKKKNDKKLQIFSHKPLDAL